MRSSLPTSHGFHPHANDDIDGLSSAAERSVSFGELFKWAATIDQTPYLCVPEAVKFRRNFCGGETSIREYCFRLALDGGRAVARTLATEIMEHPESRMNECCFVNVRLPLNFHQANNSTSKVDSEFDAANGPRIVQWVMDRLVCEFDTWIPGKFYGGAVWMRLSAQIYLEIKDFEWAGTVLKGLCERVGKGEWRGPLEKVR